MVSTSSGAWMAAAICSAVPEFPALEVGEDFELEGDDGGGGFFAGFDAGLVVGVDVDEVGVEADGAFEEGDEDADGAGATWSRVMVRIRGRLLERAVRVPWKKPWR